MACAPSEDSDQPGHPPSLIRVFAVRMKKACVLSYPLMPRLIWVFTGRTCHFMVLSWGGSPWSLLWQTQHHPAQSLVFSLSLWHLVPVILIHVICHISQLCVIILFLTSCYPEWTGKLCDETLNHCYSLPCYNQGTCSTTVKGFHCSCTDGKIFTKFHQKTFLEHSSLMTLTVLWQWQW